MLLVKEPVNNLSHTYAAALALLGLANVSLRLECPVDGAAFLGAISSLLECTVLSLDPYQKAEAGRVERDTREILGDDAYARAWEAGKAQGWSAIAALRQAGAH
jgi:hypothetical protein